MIRAAASLVALCNWFLIAVNPLSLHLLCNQDNHLFWSKQPVYIVAKLTYILHCWKKKHVSSGLIIKPLYSKGKTPTDYWRQLSLDWAAQLTEFAETVDSSPFSQSIPPFESMLQSSHPSQVVYAIRRTNLSILCSTFIAGLRTTLWRASLKCCQTCC